jgi:hypothetical protein
MGISFGIVTALGLTALFESLQVLEDPFVGFLALDGIDVKEEFQVLLWTSLVSRRASIFPQAPHYPVKRRRALTDDGHKRSGHLTPTPSIFGLGTFSRHNQKQKQDRDLNNSGKESLQQQGTTHETLTEEETNGPGGGQSKVINEATEFGTLLEEDNSNQDGTFFSGDSTVGSGVRESNFKLPQGTSSRGKPDTGFGIPRHRRNNTIA